MIITSRIIGRIIGNSPIMIATIIQKIASGILIAGVLQSKDRQPYRLPDISRPIPNHHAMWQEYWNL